MAKDYFAEEIGTSSPKNDYFSQEIAGNNENSDSNIKNNVIGGAALAGAGYGAYKGIKRFREPYVIKGQNEKILKGMQADLGITGTELKFVPQALNQQKQDIISQARAVKNDLGAALKNIDNKVVPNSSSDLANHIVVNSADFNKNLSKAYDAGINSISDFADQQGFKFTSKNFIEDVLDAAIDQAKSSGSPAENLTPLENAKKAILSRSTVTDKYGKPFGQTISLKDANSAISKVVNQNPYSPEAAILRKTWSGFIEKNAPETVFPAIKKLNDAYKPAVEARTLISKFVDSKTGTFDTKKLSNYIADYAKGKRGSDVEGVIDLFTKGNSLSKPMPGVGEKFSKISELAKQRDSIVGQIQNITKTTDKTTANLVKQINNSKTVLSKIAQAEQRIANRNIVAKGFKYLTGLGNKSLRAIGPIGIVAQAGSLAQNPADALNAMYFLPTKEQQKKQFDEYLRMLDTAVTEGTISREDARLNRFLAQGGI